MWAIESQELNSELCFIQTRSMTGFFVDIIPWQSAFQTAQWAY